MQNIELTNKQKKVLDFIGQRDIPPTIREIAKHMGFSSTGTVRDYLLALEKKGYIRQAKNRLSRSIEILKYNLNKIPILASIPAGSPNLAYEDIEGYIELDNLFKYNITDKDIFALKVKGDSMIEAGINENDIAIIKKTQTAENNDIVAALFENNEATLKIFIKNKNEQPFLKAANKNYKPIHKDFNIVGKLVGIIRKYT